MKNNGICYASKLSLNNRKNEKIPIKIRKVTYQSVFVSKKTGNVIVLDKTYGYEPVEEVSIIKEFVDEYKRICKPEIVGEKIVNYVKPRIPYKTLIKDKISFEEKYYNEIEEWSNTDKISFNKD